MFSISVRDHIMIAHSLRAEVFGPAQNLHGATFVVDARFSVKELDENNLVINIDTASSALKKVLSALNYRNLDDHEELKTKITTAEYTAYYIFSKMAEELKGSFVGGLEVSLEESHVASASYVGSVS